MTITESLANERLLLDLEFLKPFAARNVTEFTFEPNGNETRLTWSMTGRNSFFGKAASLIFNCEKMVGGQFGQGFANLREIVEQAPALSVPSPSAS
jgi:hypothetical protein